MTHTHRAAAERLAAYHAEQADHFSPFGSGNALTIFHGEAAALLRELLAATDAENATVEPVQEPVALMWQHEETGRVTFTTMADPYVGKRWHRIPLYAAAPQQPMHCPKDGGECGAGGYCRPEQRKPLTPSMQAEVECDCLVAWNASTYGHSAQDTVHPMFLSAFLRGYRAAERAHGITGEPT